jgi:membrane-associated phospholipid phosphatase
MPRIGWRPAAIGLLLVAYAVLTALVLISGSPLLRFDSYLKHLDLWYRYPGWHDAITYYVMLGQRGPATLTFLPFFIWVAWRQRSTAPLVLLGTALLWLNFSVGVAKYALGRVGPMHSNQVHKFFDLGNSIYPSGHVSNAVVLYGLVAWVAPKYRKTLIGIAVFLSVTVGLCTVYLRTHWFSDIVGGWIAGGLVLLTLPYMMPTAQRWADRIFAAIGAWWSRRRAPRRLPHRPSPPPAHRPSPVQPVHYSVAPAPKVTPVSSSAVAHSRLATSVSIDALDERTRCG